MPNEKTITHEPAEDIDFQQIFESSPNPYLILRANPPHFTIATAANGFFAVSQTSREQIMGKALFDVFPDNPDDPTASGVSDFRISLQRVCQSGMPDTVGIQRYDIPTQENGKEVFIVKYWTPTQYPIFNKKGKLVFILSQSEDVTEYVLLQEKVLALENSSKKIPERYPSPKKTNNEHAMKNLESHNPNQKKEEKIDFKLIFESTPNPYLIVRADSPSFTIVAVNESYLSATKTSREFLLGKSLFEAFPDNPNDPNSNGTSDLFTSLQRVFEKGIPDVLGVQRYDIPKRQGEGFEVKYWSPTQTPIFDQDGKIEFINHRVEDVTDYILLQEKLSESKDSDNFSSIENNYVEAEILRSTREMKEFNRKIKISNQELQRKKEELKELNEKLKELDIAKTEFFSNVSHEFRTPLTLMLGPIEDALNDTLPSSPNYVRLEVAQRNALRLLKLVNTLLDFSRLEAGRVQANYCATDLSLLTNELASHFDSAVEKAGLEYLVNCPSLPELFYVDKSMWEKIVLNLLSNAFKHTFEGKIEISLHFENEKAVLTVSDSGIGMSKEQLPNIFDRFYRVANVKSRTHEGSGIGLALVKELVKLHHGSIEVVSEINQGTTFTVCIPSGTQHLPLDHIISQSDVESTAINPKSVVEEVMRWLPNHPSADISTEEVAPRMPETTPWLGINPNEPKIAKILLADDNSDMRNYIRRLIEPYCEIIVAVDGLAALELLRHTTVDLILSDVMMPNMTGFEFLHAIRNDATLKFTPFILLSARAGESAKIEGLQTGADDYLVKPFSANELLARVKTNLDHHRFRSKMNADLRRASLLKTQFISNMSHELRTPLNAIIGYSEMILKGMISSDEMQNKFINNISSAGRHLLDLINDILDLSKIEAGKVELHIEWIEVRPFINNIHLLLKELAAKKNILLNYDIAPKLEKIKADPVRLKQILINLINNAIKFNQVNGCVDMHLYQSEDKLWVICKVKDTGIGIPENKISELFTEFYQVDNSLSRTHEGTGLGLALTKRLVQLHGGTICVESCEGVGTTFTFTIPDEMSTSSSPTDPQTNIQLVENSYE